MPLSHHSSDITLRLCFSGDFSIYSRCWMCYVLLIGPIVSRFYHCVQFVLYSCQTLLDFIMSLLWLLLLTAARHSGNRVQPRLELNTCLLLFHIDVKRKAAKHTWYLTLLESYVHLSAVFYSSLGFFCGVLLDIITTVGSESIALKELGLCNLTSFAISDFFW